MKQFLSFVALFFWLCWYDWDNVGLKRASTKSAYAPDYSRLYLQRRRRARHEQYVQRQEAARQVYRAPQGHQTRPYQARSAQPQEAVRQTYHTPRGQQARPYQARPYQARPYQARSAQSRVYIVPSVATPVSTTASRRYA